MVENYKQLNHSAEEIDEAILSEKTHVNDSVSHITAAERKNWNNAFNTSKNLQNQVDNLIVEGTPTEGNAELLDMRVGADGNIYPTAGEAVRTQFNTIRTQLNTDTHKIDMVESALNINLSDFPLRDGFITINNEWYYGENGKHILIPVVAGEVYRLSANVNKETRYAFLDFTGVDFVDGYTSRRTIPANGSEIITIPSDCKFLYLYATSTQEGESHAPDALHIIGNSKIINLEPGALTDGYVNVTGFNCYYPGNILRFSYENNLYANNRTTNFISARDFIKFDSGVSGYLYEYDSGFAFLRCSCIEESMTLAPATRYIKVHIPGRGPEVLTTWSFVDLNGNESLNRITSDYIFKGDFDFVELKNECKLLYNFYDENYTLIGNGNGIYGHYATRDMISYRFNSVVDGKTWDDVAYIKFSMGYFNNTGVNTANAPKIYKFGTPTVSQLTIVTNSDNSVAINPGLVDTTCSYAYPVRNDKDGKDYYSRMIIRFPKNYSNTGTPTKVIFFKTGSRGFQNLNDTSDFVYLDYIKYWVDEGYIVFDCHGGTSKYPTTDSFGMPMNLKSIKSAWEFLCNNFNVDKTGMYVTCKSLGGYTAHQLIFNGNLPVKAAALLAPAIDNKRYCFGYYRFQRINFAEDAELEGDISVLEQGDDTTSIGNQAQHTEEFKTLIKNNVNQLTGYLPMCSNVINKTIDELLELNAETENSFADVVRIVNVPTRYWVAKDDTDTPYNIADNFVKSCQNSGSPVTMRTMPNNTGGHHSVDYAENAPKTTITTRLGVTYEDFPVAWVEALRFLEKY